MRNTKQSIALVASGVMLGTAIAAPAATAALTAQQSSQKIVVDGKPVQIEAYAINGNNYCKLRDIGKAVGFDVSYDAVSNTVHIRTAPAVQLPTDGSQYVPQIGDRILCDDGTEYEIKDVERWKSIPLPTPTCDWNAFPTLTLPEPVVKHYSDKYGDDLFVRNVFEVRRMVYTIYNASRCARSTRKSHSNTSHTPVSSGRGARSRLLRWFTPRRMCGTTSTHTTTTTTVLTSARATC